jgi:hypothetical protein
MGQIILKLPLKFPNKAKKMEQFLTFDVTEEHERDLKRFRADLSDAIKDAWPVLAKHVFSVSYGGKSLPPSGIWKTKDFPLDVSYDVKPMQPGDEIKIRAGKKDDDDEKEDEVKVEANQDLLDAIKYLTRTYGPCTVVPCSCIDSTHKNEPDVKRVGQRCLSVGQIQSQQRLDVVLSALRGAEQCSLVLIDPGFDRGSGHQIMVQIVEYLQDHAPQKYRFKEKHAPKVQGFTYTCGKVTITYIAEFVNKATTVGLGKMQNVTLSTL